jgi:hypothetical protein
LLWLSSGLFLLALLVQFYAEALGAFIVSECHSLGVTAVGRCARPMQFALVARALAFAACCGWFWCFRQRALRRAGFYQRAA